MSADPKDLNVAAASKHFGAAALRSYPSKGPALTAGKTGPAAEYAERSRQEAEVKKAAIQFEAMLLQEMLKSMWSTVPKEGMLSGSREEAYYRDMFNEALAGSLAEGKGLGIKDVISKELDGAKEKVIVRPKGKESDF